MAGVHQGGVGVTKDEVRVVGGALLQTALCWDGFLGRQGVLCGGGVVVVRGCCGEGRACEAAEHCGCAAGVVWGVGGGGGVGRGNTQGGAGSCCCKRTVTSCWES